MSEIHGRIDPAFARVGEAFRRNFAELGEIGAGVTVVVEGKTVVDLWGGAKNGKTGEPWREDTITIVFSSTKGATALCAHLLASRGLLDLDAPVARYWPEFAAAGKESIPVRMLLNHRAGLPAVSIDLAADAYYRWDTMVDALARQAPWWEPGSAHGYHAITMGYLVGEVVRRVSGRSLGTFFREEIAAPLGLDFWVGLPEAHEGRAAFMKGSQLPEVPSPLFIAMGDPETVTHRAFLNPASLFHMREVNSRAMRAAEIPAANGMASARGLAGMYVPLAEERGLDGIGADAVARMGRVESEGEDRVLLAPTRFAAGFMKTMDNRPGDSAILGPNEAAFGHVGAGGSIGFADPVARVGFGYVMNHMGDGFLLNPRGQGLIDAVYASL